MQRIMIALVLLMVLGTAAFSQEVPAPASNSFAGSYTGRFAGDMSGTMEVVIAADGLVTAAVNSGGENATLTGKAAGTGEVWLTASQGGQMLISAGLLRREAGQVTGSGAWITSTNAKGTWRIGAAGTTAVAGTYQGSYSGDDSGAFSLQVTDSNAATATFDSAVAGKVTASGQLAPDGKLSLSGTVQGEKLTVSGEIKGGAGAGTWNVGSQASGTWAITAPVSPATAGTSPFAGSYAGTFSGSGSGTVSMQIAADGSAQGTFDSSQAGKIALTGTVASDGQVSLTATVRSMELAVKGTFTKDAADTAGHGTWQVATYSGEWTVKPGAPAAP